ncbi:RNA-binding protein S4 [Alicyclobacillus cellulosilyticus]|uniref:RNA-binding protein S4 n=1 Tax=Alicyclobacillus cellulosilyticus TaxID=1003997 RepID=A0A917JZV6_9BACL|nr:S4 domain-containing protein YaaA [Alicyclobacillus cellulosilyticus]GGI95018.1 RNA-binding protein S4 [Alicyclobacillus cellulosilyticus]
MTTVQIYDDHITLGQLLKKLRFVDSGGAAKHFLTVHDVRVNGEIERRRGRKLRPGDVVEVLGQRVRIEAE